MNTKEIPTVCIYHANCLDGFTAAWVVSRYSFIQDIEFVAGSYNTQLNHENLRGKNVIFVDFSVKHDEMCKILDIANYVAVLDHHKTAQQELENLEYEYSNCRIIFDMDQSGAMITWKYFSDKPAPFLIRTVQDRDLWKFEMEDTKAITAYMFSLEMTFDVWDTLSIDAADGHASRYGNILLRSHDKNVSALIEGCTYEAQFGDYKINVTNVPWMFASDIGHHTVDDNLFSLTYFINKDGKMACSLRANDGFDCASFAKTFSGGGHTNAAGFTLEEPLWTRL